MVTKNIKTCSKVQHNCPDIVAWNHTKKQCTTFEMSCPLDVNISTKEIERTTIYGPMMRSMQLMYSGHQFSFVPIFIGAGGYVTNNLIQYLTDIGFTEQRLVDSMTRKFQVLAISGTAKITKAFKV